MFVLLETLMSFTTLSIELVHLLSWESALLRSNYLHLYLCKKTLVYCAPIDLNVKGLTSAALLEPQIKLCTVFYAFYGVIVD